MDKLTDEEKTQVLENNAIIKFALVVRIMRCIEIASSKGAYGPSEMTFVGGVYDVLLKGLNDAFEEEIKKKTTTETIAEETVTELAEETSKLELAEEPNIA